MNPYLTLVLYAIIVLGVVVATATMLRKMKSGLRNTFIVLLGYSALLCLIKEKGRAISEVEYIILVILIFTFIFEIIVEIISKKNSDSAAMLKEEQEWKNKTFGADK